MEAVVLTFSFTAGAVSAFNPCGVAMLPAYLAHLFARKSSTALAPSPRWTGFFTGAGAGALMTLGFVLVFFAAGLLVTVAAQTIRSVLPWAAFVIGLVLVAVGVLMLMGRKPLWLAGLPTTVDLASRERAGGPKTFFLYGIAFATASLGCTLPVFLIVVAQSFGVGLVAGLSGFLAYALGMGAVVIALSAVVGGARHAADRWIRAVLPRVERVSALLITGAGLYLAYYWLWGPGALVR